MVEVPPPPYCGSICFRSSSRSALGNGRDRTNTPSTTLNIAVLAPIPRASVSTATAVNPGRLASGRGVEGRSLMGAGGKGAGGQGRDGLRPAAFDRRSALTPDPRPPAPIHIATPPRDRPASLDGPAPPPPPGRPRRALTERPGMSPDQWQSRRTTN